MKPMTMKELGAASNRLYVEKYSDEVDTLHEMMDAKVACVIVEIMHRREGELQKEIDRLQHWVADLQSGMYVNCVYCGHRYGPIDEVPVAMAEVLKEHVEQCPEHPMSSLKAENAVLRKALDTIYLNSTGFGSPYPYDDGHGSG